MQKIKVKKYANVLYHQRFLKCGGVERYITEVCYKYSRLGYDLDLFYVECLNNDYLKEIASYIGEEHIHKYKGEIVYCHTLLINYDMKGFIENVYCYEAKNIIHANFLLQNKFELHDDPKITERLAVSKENAIAFKKRFGLNCKVCYNPITIKPNDTRRVLNIISCTRLSEEKGKPRMVALMNLLDKNNIPYIWHIFTNSKDDIKNPNVMYHEPTIDVRPYINNSDYLVQLSDSEGYCYSVLEALAMGVPVIVTDLPVFKEMGVIQGKNGFILSLDMKNVPINEIYEKNLKGFRYTPKEDDYVKYLYKGKTTEVEEIIMKVKITKPVHDTAEKVHYVSLREYGISKINKKDGEPNMPIGTIVDLAKPRAEKIVEAGFGVYVDEVKKVKKPRASKTDVKKVK